MIFFEAEVLLANILSELQLNEGVNHDDLAIYCDEIRKELYKLGMSKRYIYFEICQSDVTHKVNCNSDLFVQMGDKTFDYNIPNPDYFNKRFPKDISDALKIAAKNCANKLYERNTKNEKYK